MFDYKDLKLRIKKVFDTQQAFAVAMDMPYSQINLRLNNKVQWKSPEMYKACMLLDIPIENMHKYFYKLKV